jgi:hypothetical protein
MPCPGQSLPGVLRGHRSWTPSRKWLRAKGFRHGRASEYVGQEALMTSLRSSVAGATLAFTMPLVPPDLCCFLLVLSHLLWGMSATAPAICSPVNGCLHLLPASGFADGSSPLGSGGRPAGRASVWPLLGESLSFPFMERQATGAGTPLVQNTNTLSISPILIIDDNLFERVYIMN